MKKRYPLLFLSVLLTLATVSCTGASKYHTVTFDSNGGSPVPSQKVKHGEKVEKPVDPTRGGYSISGWMYNDEPWSFVGYVVTEDMTLLASWFPNRYLLTITYDSPYGRARGGGYYYYGLPAVVTAETKVGYSFLGWYDSQGNLLSNEEEYSFNMGFDLELFPKWNEGNEYTVTFDPNSGTISQTSITVQYNKSYVLPTPEKRGYAFDGWYDGNTKVDISGIWSYGSNRNLIAKWSVANYTITYNLNGGTNNKSNPYTYTLFDSVTFADPIRQGYTFDGWYKDDIAITEIPLDSVGDVILDARWTALKNILTVTSADDSRGSVTVLSGTGYSGESISLVATPAEGYIFGGWFAGQTKVSKLATYTFEMPGKDYSLTAKFFTQEEKETEDAREKALGIEPVVDLDNMTVTYGLYPQTNVKNSSILSALNKLSSPEPNGWYLYNNEYYAKTIAETWTTGDKYWFDNNNIIVNGTTYWFKCEPITWKILSNNNGEYSLLSTLLLDHCYYYDSDLNRTINGQTIYPNNYEYSDIRTYLNEDFYNSAFALGSYYVQTTIVDNTDESNQFVSCNDTEDKVFIPSYYDLNDIENDARLCKTTDWDRARGGSTWYMYSFNGDYWTRTFYFDNMVYVVSMEGNLGVTDNCNDLNIRPCIVLKIA